MLTLRRLVSIVPSRSFGIEHWACLVMVCIGLMLCPLSVASQDGFSISADVDGAVGDQGVTTAEVSPEATVSIQIFGSNLSQSQGISVRFAYDSGQIVYESTDAGNVYPNAQVLGESGTNPTSVTLGIASMGGRAEASAGLLGTARFRTATAFTGTTIRIVEAVLGRDGQQDTLKLDVSIDLSQAPAGPSPDFDADGTVGFSDFLQFAAQYGTTAGDGRYDARFDLDGDGSVGFSDFLVLAGIFGQEVAPPPPVAPDRNVLVALYDATDGYNWTTQTNWLTDNPLDTWHGITVEDGRVTGLVLSENNLTGEIPAALGELANLDSLKLERNALSGPIPAELGNLENLTKLELMFNQLNGSIPAEFGNLGRLRWLSIPFNQLNGSIPAELGNLDDLHVLVLTRNQLNSSIPAELGNLTNLESLWFNGNQLSGPIPSELGNLTNLWALALGPNELTGSIPAELGNLVNLQRLFLGGNQLSGPIPPELGKLSILPILSLSGNSLSGPIPSELGNLSNLVTLGLSDNKLSGAIPSEFGKLTMLKFLEVHNNASLTGALPKSLTGLTELARFYFDGTSLCAPVDAAFQRWLEGIEATRGVNCE